MAETGEGKVIVWGVQVAHPFSVCCFQIWPFFFFLLGLLLGARYPPHLSYMFFITLLLFNE